MTLNKLQLFLTSVEQIQNEIFKNKFVNENKKKNTDHMWSFPNSEKNLKIWQKINKNDWVLFYFNSRYTYAGKITKKQKSSKIAKKIFGDELKNKNLIVYCNEIYQIKKGFQKTNSDMGFQSAIPEMHKIKLLQAKETAVNKIIEKFGNIETYLEIKISKLKSKEIEKIIPSSIKKEPQKIKTTTLRRVRDTVKSKKLKKIYQNKCQICNYSFPQYVKSGYSEVHHVWPMADDGDDDFDNMLVLCPNHHTEFDYRIIQFNSSKNNIIEDLKGEKLGTISFKKGHSLDDKNVLFHNAEVRRTFFES
jgi:hypothetical protein